MTIAQATAIAQANPASFIIATMFGLLSCVGPCVQARVTFGGGKAPALAFLVTNIATYGALGFAGGLVVEALYSWSPLVYAFLGIASIVTGIRALLHVSAHCHDVPAPRIAALAGMTSALSFQPCCAPIILTTLTVAPSPIFASLVLMVFGVAHNAPLFASSLLSRVNTRVPQDLTAIIVGGLGIAYGCYWLILA